MNEGSQNIRVRRDVQRDCAGEAPFSVAGAVPVGGASRLRWKKCSHRLVIWRQARDRGRRGICHTSASLQRGRDVLWMDAGRAGFKLQAAQRF